MESAVNHMANDTHKNLKKKMMESTVLDSFSKLLVDSERERIEGGIILLKHLSELKDSDEDKKELKYALNRLIRGVGASRVNSRKGFYSCVVAVLSIIPITISEVLEILNSQLQTCSNNSKSEKAEIYMGQILVSGAVIRSGLFESSSFEDQSKIIQILITAGKQRSYLSLACYNFIINLIEKINEDKFNEVLWPALKNEVLKPWADQTLDQIYTLFLIRQKFPSTVNSKFLQKSLNSPEIIHKDSIKSLCSLLLNIPLNLHLQNPIYEAISSDIAKSDCVKEWCIEVNEELNKPTRNKLLIVLSMTTYMIPLLLDTTLIPDLLTPNLILQILKVQPTMKQKKDNEMSSKLLKLFTELVLKLQNENIKDKTRLAVIKKFIFYPGRFMFEKITSTKVIQQITATLNAEGVKKLSKIYIDVLFVSKSKLNDNKVSDVWLNRERIYAADLVNKLLTHPKMQEDLEWKLEQMKFLLQIALFINANSNESDIGVEFAVSLKNCFYHSLDQKFLKLDHQRNILFALILHINEIMMLPNGNNKLRNPLSNESLQAWEKMFTLIMELKDIKKKKQNFVIPVFHTLLLHMGLQLFKNEHLALNTLEELHNCFDRIKMNENDTSTSEINKKNNEPLWTEVIIDLFLNLLSQESHLFRNIIKCVFPHLCPYVNLSTIQQLLNVLNPKNNKNPLLNNSSDDEDSSIDDNSSIEGESNNAEANEQEDEDDESAEDSDFDSNIDENEEEEAVTDELRIAVQQALRNSSVDTDDESIDLDDMDEEEGKRLNTALAEAFKSFKTTMKTNQSKKQNKIDKALTHFRVKVLDLIEIYLDSEPSLSITLEIMLPLLQTLEFAIRDEHQKPLESRLRSCIKKLATLKKFSDLKNIDQHLLSELLKSLIDKGERTASVFQDMGDKITDCCVFIIRCSQMLNTSNLYKKKKHISNSLIEDILKEALVMFFLKRDCLLPIILFKNTLQLSWDGNWSLISVIIDFAFNTEIRPFRRNQALELLIIFYGNHRLLKGSLEKGEQNLLQIENSLSKKSLAFLEKVATNPKDTVIKEKFVCLLMNLLQNIKHFHDQNQFNINGNIWDWLSIGNAIQSYRSGVSLALDAKKSYNRLCAALGIPSGKINIVSSTNEIIDQEKEIRLLDVNKNSDLKTKEYKSKNKKKKTKSVILDIQKQKKETEELRMKMMSDGLDTMLFSNISNSDFKNSGDINELLIDNKFIKTKRKNSIVNIENENKSNIERLNQNPRKKRKSSK